MQNDFLSQVAFYSQYSKENETGRETWKDAVERVLNMHRATLSFNKESLIPAVEWAFFLFLKSMIMMDVLYIIT